MKRRFLQIAAVALGLGEAIPALAAEERTLDAVEVSASRFIGVAGSATEGMIDSKRIENRPLLRPGEVLEAVPGLIITQHSGDGKANQYFLRGFNLDHGTDFSTSLMGMPVNMPTHGHGQGYSDLNFLIPELVERVQYRKGPYAAEQGDFSAAGSAAIDYFRRLDAPFVEVEAGQRNYRRTLLAGSPQAGNGHLLYALEWSSNDGPWVLPEGFRKLNGLLRLSQGTRDNGWSVAAMAYDAHWTSTDQVPQRAIDSGAISRFGYIDPSDGGNMARTSLSGDWSVRGERGWTRANAYLIDTRFNIFNNFTYFADPVRGDQFEQADRRQVMGLNAAHTWYGAWQGRTVETTVGMQSRFDRIGTLGLYLTTDRQRYATIREDSVNQASLALFAESQVQWADKFRSIVGLRGDAYRFDVSSDRAENSGKLNDRIVSPKLALIFGPWASTEYYFNAGYGFHSNDARGATLRVNPDPRDPGFLAPMEPVSPLVRAKGVEVGVRSAITPHLQTSLALWQLKLASELIFDGEAGTTTAGRPSRRHGIEWSNVWTPGSWMTVDADLALSHASFTDADPAGNRIPGAIEKTLSLGATIEGLSHWFGGLRLRYFGPRPLVEDNSIRSTSSTLVNLRVGYKFDRNLRLTLDVLNLFDRKVSDIDYYYPSQLRTESTPVNDIHTHPAEPRTLRVALRMNF